VDPGADNPLTHRPSSEEMEQNGCRYFHSTPAAARRPGRAGGVQARSAPQFVSITNAVCQLLAKFLLAIS